MTAKRKKILLLEWGKNNFDPPPSIRTLRRMARDVEIFPMPEKVGRNWYVDQDAQYVKRDDHGSEAA